MEIRDMLALWQTNFVVGQFTPPTRTRVKVRITDRTEPAFTVLSMAMWMGKSLLRTVEKVYLQDLTPRFWKS